MKSKWPNLAFGLALAFDDHSFNKSKWSLNPMLLLLSTSVVGLRVMIRLNKKIKRRKNFEKIEAIFF